MTDYEGELVVIIGKGGKYISVILLKLFIFLERKSNGTHWRIHNL